MLSFLLSDFCRSMQSLRFSDYRLSLTFSIMSISYFLRSSIFFSSIS